MSMFAVWCERHGGRVLLSSSSILALGNGPDGAAVRWRCTCGHEGVWWAGHEGGEQREVAACTP
jgi:hypothetical protein